MVSAPSTSLSGQLSLSRDHSHAAVIRHLLCSKSPLSNAFGTRIPVPSKLNIPAWKSWLEHYSDSVVADFLAFGWPINCHSVVSLASQPLNHSSATCFPDVIDSFLSTELEHSATAGPFTCNPFPAPIRTSPLQTVPKDGSKRRVVLDLSFPPGASVNDGIPKDCYLDQPFHLSLPHSSDFIDLILSKGAGCYLYKKDLKRAYRQIPVDPKDYFFLVYHWSDCLYFDLVLPFGLRSATLAFQRTTNAITHIFQSVFNHDCINYIDDFGGVETTFEEASHAFSDLERLFNELGLESSPSKDCPPSTRMVFLGLIYDTVKMTIEVPPDKLHNTFELIRHWLTAPQSTKSDLQSLIGKLSYLCACISPGRIFMQRLVNELRQLPTKRARFVPSSDMLSDLHWWNKFLSVYNGVSLLRSLPWPVSNHYFCTDACAAGISGFFSGRFFHSPFAACIDPTSLSIAALEMLAVIVSIKLWPVELHGLRILVRSDNLNTVLAINTGRSRVPFIQSCLRDLWFYASLYDFELRALHIPGYANIIADALSYWDTHPPFPTTFYEAASLHYDTLSEFICPSDLFRFECQW